MKEVVYSSQAKKDLKRYRRQPEAMRRLYEVLSLLCADSPLPARCRPHRLSGNYAGLMECHVGSDFLLIWEDGVGHIFVVRVGSHSELF